MKIFPKFLKFPKNFRGNFPKIPVGFLGSHNDTERESMFLLVGITGKARTISEKFRGNFTNSENSRKFSPKIFPKIPRKIPGKLRVFSDASTMLQSENHVFYYYKSNGNPEKFQENFGENFRNVKNSWKKFPRKISRKFRVFFRGNAMIQSENHSFYFYKR
jgi:hypothetical protein